METSDGRNIWLDTETDPHNDIGWVVDVPNSDIPGGESDSLTVAEAIALVPDRRDEIIEATRQAIFRQCEHVTLWGTYPPEHWGGWLEATAELARQLEEAQKLEGVSTWLAEFEAQPAPEEPEGEEGRTLRRLTAVEEAIWGRYHGKHREVGLLNKLNYLTRRVDALESGGSCFG